MAKIGGGRGAAKGTEAQKENTTITTKADGSIDYEALYAKVDAEKVAKGKNTAGVGSIAIREVIDGLFSTGKDEVRISVIEAMVNEIHGLKKEGDVDTRVPNASVRSAGTAADKYLITKNAAGQAVFVKNPDYKPKAA